MPVPSTAEQIARIRENREKPQVVSGRPQPSAPSKPGKKKGKKKPNYRERLGRPGQRATIPDEVLRKLDPKLYARRMQNKRYAEPIAEGSPLTYGEVVKERGAQESLQFGPQEEALRQRLGALDRGTGVQQGNITNWFDQYKNDLNTAKQAQAAQYQGAIGQVQGSIAQSQQAADTSRQQMDAEARADAERRGQVYTGSGGAQAVQAQDSRRNLQDQLIGLLSATQQSQTDYLSNRQGVGSAAQLTERLRESNRYGQEKDELSGEKQQLERERGAFRTSYMEERREKERTYGLERAAFGLDKAKAEADVAGEEADRTAAQQREDSKTNKWGYTNKEWRSMSAAKRQSIIKRQQRQGKSGTDMGKVNSYGYTEGEWRRMSTKERQDVIRRSKSTGSGKDKEGLTPAQRNAKRTREEKRREKIREKTGTFAEDVNLVRDRKPGSEDRQNLITGRNSYNRKFHPVVVDAGIELNTQGFVSDKTIQRMHKLGLRVPRAWLRKRSGAERRPPSSNPGAGN